MKTGFLTDHIHKAKPGDRVGLRGPFGSAYPLEEFENRDLLILGGGCGLAPLRSLFLTLLDEVYRYKSITFYAGPKTPLDCLYKDAFPGWRKHPKVKLVRAVDAVPPGETWDEAVGVVTTLLVKLSLISSSAGGPPPAASARCGGDTAPILYTGGTPWFPKGVPISHALFLVSADEQIRTSEPLFPPEDNVVMANAPLFHILGQTCSLAALLVGGCLIIQPRINLDAAFDAIQRFRARTMIGVPALYRMILEHSRLDQYDLSSLEYCFSGGDVLPTDLGRRWLEKFGRPIRQGYGATETCGGVAMCPVDRDNPPKSVGRVVASKKAKLLVELQERPILGLPETAEPGSTVGTASVKKK